MPETPKPLDKKTLDRLSREWNKRSGGTPFSLTAEVHNLPSGEQRDAIKIIEGKESEAVTFILDFEMNDDLPDQG